MKHDYVGIELLKIAAFLFAARYVSAAIYMGPGAHRWGTEPFEASLAYVGPGLPTGAGMAAAAGVMMLIIAAKKKRD